MPAVQPAPAPAMQRRHSSASSSDAGSDHQGLNSRQTSQENISLIPTRMTKVATSKPAANPLQFVKIGPCDLSRHAQEQLKKVEEVKKVKPEKRDEAEDWQSNLDNWKCSRRKRQEHIIERVVEVKKLELEEHDRNRRRSKTFSEMLEDRNTKGRKTSLPVYQDDDNDFSDLGLSSSKSVDDDNVFDKEKESCDTQTNGNGKAENGTETNGYSRNDQREPSTEQEEYTYERAIQNYVNFTESRVLGKTQQTSETENSKLTNGFSKKPSPPIPTKPRRSSCKIEEKLSELEQIKKKSMSTNDLTESSKKPLSLPKVDILKRREMFEKSQEETSNTKNRHSGDFSSTKSIKDRLSSLGKSTDDIQNTKKNTKIASDISVKDRLSNIEKRKSVDYSITKSNGSLNENIPSSQTLKQRLSTLQNSSNSETKSEGSKSNVPKDVTDSKETPSKKTKTKKNNSSPKPKVNQKESKVESSGNNVLLNNDLLPTCQTNATKEEVTINHLEDTRESSVTSPIEDIYESKRQQHYRHRSLDSLDVDSTDGLGNDAFERVQSLEDLDFCRNYPASSVSGDTDREDSGIHTADVSSSVSQADDCDLHLDPAEFNQQPTIVEEINKHTDSLQQTSLTSKLINKTNVSDSLIELPSDVVPLEVMDNSSALFKLPLRLDCDPLPIILESPSEPIPPITISDSSNPEPNTLPSSPSDSSPVIISSQTNITNNTESDSNSKNKSGTVNNNADVTLVNIGGGEKSVANILTVNTTQNSLSTLPVELSPAEVVHDSNSGAMEICHKIDLSDLTTPLPLEPQVAVEAHYTKELGVAVGVEGMSVGTASHHNHMTALTVDTSSKPNLTLPLLPNSTFLSDSTKVVDNLEAMFPLSPSTLEPPKEKPPPPPTEISDDDDTTSSNNKSVSLRRLDSTKRIKKEIRQKRSSFLGIEGSVDDNYLEPELELVRRPPDISSFLAEEKRLEQLLYRQSICSESESRDSGVELEKHTDDLTWPTVHHSRDNSETYANTSTTSEEEEIVKKEREIIEILEREEINRYSSSSAQDKANIGEKLAERLRELEAEKSRLEWEREEELARRKADEMARAEHQSRIQARERELCKQESTQDVQEMELDTEMLMVERERLEAEQANLARQRDLMLQQHTQQYNNHNRSLTDVRLAECYPDYHRRSMQDLRTDTLTPAHVPQRRPVVEPAQPLDNRRSMPDLSAQPRRPPPPIPPAKPLLIPRTQDKRMSSPQQMTRQTLQALSAAPKPRLNDNWLQSKRKPNNYQQHWLIQEAEQRRIVEHHQRQAVGNNVSGGRRPVPPPPQPQPQPQAVRSAGTGQYINWQPEKRQDKPLPDSIIQTLTQRVQNRLHTPADNNNNRRRAEQSQTLTAESQEKMLSVSGKKKCSHCGDELGRGAAMIIESLRLFYHIDCFKCCVCCVQLGDGMMGTDVRVRNNKLHCHNCYSSDDGVKFSCV